MGDKALGMRKNFVKALEKLLPKIQKESEHAQVVMENFNKRKAAAAEAAKAEEAKKAKEAAADAPYYDASDASMDFDLDDEAPYEEDPDFVLDDDASMEF